ncbi:MAG: hypothetical protein JNK04_08875 [Myxococcales bacterium]|nr:hypothetical protein [Myxococcales bacterium]
MFVSYAGVMAELKQNELRVKYAIFPEEAYTVLTMAGSYPDNVQARVYFDSWASPGYQRQAPIKEMQTHTFLNGKLSQLGLASDAPLKIAGWKGGNGLKLEKGSIGVLGSGDPPKQAVAPDGAPCKGAAVTTEEIDALPSGEVFLLGKRCGQGAYVTELLGVDGKSIIEDLPGAPSTAKRAFIAAGSSSRAYVVISTGEAPYFATWDGHAMRRIDLDASGDVTSVWVSPDGALFFLLIQKGRAELWRLLPTGEAQKSGVFAPSPNASVWAADKDTAYVPSFRSILSTKPGLVFTGYAEKKDDAAPVDPGPPQTGLPRFTDACPTPFVWLFDVSQVAGPDFTFPNTRGALSSYPKLAEITLVEIKVGSGRKLGVVVPSKTVGEEVVAHVKKHMKDENPGLACYKPADDARIIKVK